MPDRDRRNAPQAPQTELIIGLVGAVGIDLSAVVVSLRAVLSKFAYQCHDLHLTDQLSALDWTDVPLIREPLDERLDSYMTAGDKLRERWGRNDAFGLLAVNAVTTERNELSAALVEPDDDLTAPLDRHAYIVRSLKRSEEASLLRDVYGSRFILFSIYSPKQARLAYLKRRIRQSRVVPNDPKPKHKAKDLIKRDEDEAIAHGQDVRGIFHKGDFFVDATEDLDGQLQRTMEILFGHPRRTPTRDEFGMFQAAAAARRSAELGRQVGAAICTKAGDVVAVGTNEVPKFGGGLYWEDDPGDAREFKKGRDTSDHRKATITKQIVKELDDAELLARDADMGAVEELILDSEFGDLIEYYRAVHAEMAAVTDAARRGIPLQDDALYVTTFPCHHCARHIVAAGLSRVVYIAPYPKSLAEELHGDAIVVDPHPRDSHLDRVVFEPFVGVGPLRYLELFEMPKRKRSDGKIIPFKPKKALPRLREIEPPEMVPEALPYILRETSAILLLNQVVALGPAFK